MKHTLAFIVLAIASCGAPPSPSSTAPPHGTSYDDYLKPEAPEQVKRKPTGTNDADEMVVHVIDVGQGAATLVEFPCGAILVDTGGELNPLFDSWPGLRDYLDAFFVRRSDLDNTLSLLVITHPHLDHTRNIESILRRYKIENVIDNGAISGDSGVDQQVVMHDWLTQRPELGHRDINARDVPDDGLTDGVIDPIKGCERAATDPLIRALWGGKESEEIGDNANDHSVVLRIDYGESSVLLPGDIERLSIARITKKYGPQPGLLNVDIYQVPHHGSRNSTAEHLIRAVSPEVAVISMGPYERLHTFTARRFGHPHNASVSQLRDDQFGVSGKRAKPAQVHIGLRGGWKERASEFEDQIISEAIYATGWDGTIRVHANTNGWIEVETTKNAPAQRAPSAP